MTPLRIARRRVAFYLLICLGVIRTLLGGPDRALGAGISGHAVSTIRSSSDGSEASLPPASPASTMEAQTCDCDGCDGCDGCEGCDNCDSCDGVIIEQ